MSSVGERGRPEGDLPASGAPAPVAPEALPLRLSVARGALGIELSRPMSFGPLVLEELSLALVGVRFPVDLSKGVKQFRNRRATLEHATLRIRVDELGALFAPQAEAVLGEKLVQLRLAPSGFAPASNQSSVEPCLSFTLVGATRLLAFDCVLSSGLVPRWVIDRARGHGWSEPPLRLALAFVDAVIAAWGGTSGEVVRTGRAIEVRELARALCLRTLPSLGFRVPAIGEQVVQRTAMARGELFVSLDAEAEPLAVGRRGVRLAGLAEFARRADEALVGGEAGLARQLYLAALELSPRHAEVLWTLAALDLSHGGRAESALSFLEEVQAADRDHALALHHQLEALALEQSARQAVARDSWLAAATHESDPLLSAAFYCRLADDAPVAEQLRLLQKAIERAPALARCRSRRFHALLEQGDLRGALADAEHWDALCADTAGRPAVCREVGQTLLAAGFRSEALTWLKRAVRLDPQEPWTRLAMARALALGEENLRAIEILQTLVGASSDPELEDQVRFDLASLLVREALDPSQAIAHLRAIDSRSPWGLRARVLEGELADQNDDVQTRVRAHVRLLEAVELGWITVGVDWTRLLGVARLEASRGNVELASRAARACRVALTEMDAAKKPSASGQAVDSDQEFRAELKKLLVSLVEADAKCD